MRILRGSVSVTLAPTVEALGRRLTPCVSMGTIALALMRRGFKPGRRIKMGIDWKRVLAELEHTKPLLSETHWQACFDKRSREYVVFAGTCELGRSEPSYWVEVERFQDSWVDGIQDATLEIWFRDIQKRYTRKDPKP